MQIDKNKLLLTATRGTHILKPIPAQRLERVEEMPANEHISMQLASQVFKIPVAACAMIFFNDGSPAYITRRFDYKPDGTKYQLEDFAALLSRSPEKVAMPHGPCLPFLSRQLGHSRGQTPPPGRAME